MANITLKDGVGGNLSVGAYPDANGNLALGHVPLVGGQPVGPSNPMPTTPTAMAPGAPTSAKQDTANAALGAPADPEASGDGSLIGLLKRLRTLLSGVLQVTIRPGTITDTITKTQIVAGAAAVQVAAANPNRKTLLLLNDGTGDAYYGFSSSLNASDGGMPAKADGGYEWTLGSAPTGAVFVFSTAGTIIRVKEGA